MSGYECLYLIPKAQYESYQSQGDRVVRDGGGGGVASINIRQLNNISDTVRATLQANDITKGGQKLSASNAAVTSIQPGGNNSSSGSPPNFGQATPSTDVGENFGQIRERGVKDLLPRPPPPPSPFSPSAVPSPPPPPSFSHSHNDDVALPTPSAAADPPATSEPPTTPHVSGDKITPTDNAHTHENFAVDPESSFTSQIADDLPTAPPQTDGLGAASSSQTDNPNTHSVYVPPAASGSIWDFSRKRRRTDLLEDGGSVEPEKEKPRGHNLSVFSPPDAQVTTQVFGKQKGVATATQTDETVLNVPPTTKAVAVQTRRQRPHFIVAKKPMNDQGVQTVTNVPPTAAAVAKPPMIEQSAQTHEILPTASAAAATVAAAAEQTVKPSWQFKMRLPARARGQRARPLGIGFAKKTTKQEQVEPQVAATQTLLDDVLPQSPKKVSRKKRPPQKFTPEPIIRKRAAPPKTRGVKKVVPPPSAPALESGDEEMQEENLGREGRGRRLKKKSAVMLSYLQSKKEGGKNVKPRWIPTARRAKKPKLLAGQRF